jgi:hypothetical protein
VRRHDDRPLSGIYLANMERQEILVFYQWKKWMRVAT